MCERGHVHSYRVHSQSPSLPLGQAFPAAKKTLPETGGPSPGCWLIACVAPAGLPSSGTADSPGLGLGPHTSRRAGKRSPANTRDAHSRAFSPVIHLSPLSSLLFPSILGGREAQREEGREGGWGQLVPGAKLLAPPPPDLQLQRASHSSDRGTEAPWRGHFNVTLSGLAPEAGSLLPTPWCQSNTPVRRDSPATSQMHFKMENTSRRQALY